MPAHLSLAEQERERRKTELGLAAISEKGRMKMCDTARKQRDGEMQTINMTFIITAISSANTTSKIN